MAKSPAKTSARSRSGARARPSAGTRKTGAAKVSGSKQVDRKNTPRSAKGAARQRSERTARKPQGTREAQSENWAASVGTLLTSDLSREILAEVLNAAAGVLRQNRRASQQVQDTGRAMLDRSTESASTAVQVGTEVAAGAVDAGTEISVAAAEMAQTAAGALAAMATNAMLNMLPGASTGAEKQQNRGRRRGAGKSESDSGAA
jgi:hypothetical protein